MHLVVTANEVFFDSVKNVKPHGGAKELGSPFDLRIHVWLAHRSMTYVLGNVVGSHGSDINGLEVGGSFFVALVVGGCYMQDCYPGFSGWTDFLWPILFPDISNHRIKISVTSMPAVGHWQRGNVGAEYVEQFFERSNSIGRTIRVPQRYPLLLASEKWCPFRWLKGLSGLTCGW